MGDLVIGIIMVMARAEIAADEAVRAVRERARVRPEAMFIQERRSGDSSAR